MTQEKKKFHGLAYFPREREPSEESQRRIRVELLEALRFVYGVILHLLRLPFERRDTNGKQVG